MLFRPNRLLTLRNFIPKKTNQVARAKGIDFVGAQQASPNLLILAAPSGAGKTHLIHALANFAKRNDAIHSVTCLSATQFADEIVRAEFYRDKELQIQRFAQEDLLALDDVDRLFHQQVAADTLLEVLAMRQTSVSGILCKRGLG